MNTVTIPKKEYEILKEARRRFNILFRPPLKIRAGKSKFSAEAFGILKKSFDKKPSTFYVSKMRKSWRS